MSTRLHLAYPALAEFIEGLPPSTRQRLLVFACRFAVRSARLVDEEAEAVLRNIEAASPGVWTPEEGLAERLQAWSQAYDDSYLDRLEEWGDAPPGPTVVAALRRFSASYAVMLAARGDPSQVHEIVYEATICHDNGFDEVVDFMNGMLSGQE